MESLLNGSQPVSIVESCHVGGFGDEEWVRLEIAIY